MTVSKLYKQLKEVSARETAAFDISQLIDKRTGVKSIRLTAPERELSLAEQSAIEADFKRLEEGYPLQYLLGEWDFWGLTLKVGAGVLIPRADTEISVETALRLLEGASAPLIADLCSGSGAIALALASEIKDSRIFAVELFDEALFYLRENIAALDKRGQVTAIKADVLKDLIGVLPAGLDMIISNPPYVTEAEIKELSPEVRHEPKTALFGGEEGLDFYRAISENAKALLKVGGWLVFEAGFSQAGKVAAIMEQNGFCDIAFAKDINGIDRCIYGRRPL